jgi:hypothetical protein
MSGSITATTAIAAAGLALSAVGTGVSVMGQIQQAHAQKASADYQSQVAAGNAKIATQNAAYAGAEGEQKAAIQEQKTRAEVGSELAAQGASGVDINSPTASAVRTSTGEVGALDAQTIRSDAARQAYGYEVKASEFTNNAAADTASGQNAETAGYVGGAGSLLSGAGNAGLNYASVMNKNTGLVGSAENPASSNYAAAQSYNAIDNYGAGSN